MEGQRLYVEAPRLAPFFVFFSDPLSLPGRTWPERTPRALASPLVAIGASLNPKAALTQRGAPSAYARARRIRYVPRPGTCCKKKIPAASYSPTRSPCSTIGSEELNFRVRDGIGCGLFDITTGNLWVRPVHAHLERSVPASWSMLCIESARCA